jgi:hypothetical protein
MTVGERALVRLNLTNIPISWKILFSGYLLVIGCGLLMSGAQILLTHGMADGKFGLSVDDIVYSYYGNRGDSILEAKLSGTMKDKASTKDKAQIVKWVQSGSPLAEWEGSIQEVFARNCVKCHGGVPGLAAFTTYDGIKPYTTIDTGATVSSLARVSHIHLFGIAFIFFFVCAIFSFAKGVPVPLKLIAIGFPFAFILVDIASWWLIKWYPSFAWLEIIAGLGYFSAAAFMILTSLYQMWLAKEDGASPLMAE